MNRAMNLAALTAIVAISIHNGVGGATSPETLEDSTRIDCVPGVRDRDQPGTCVKASTQPELGRLYPLSELFFIAPDGRVGFGTADPTGEYHLRREAGDARLRLESLAGLASLSLLSNGDGPASIWSPSGSNDMRFSVGGVDRMALTESGFVGIRTTAPNEELTVNGEVAARGIQPLNMAPGSNTFDLSAATASQVWLRARTGGSNPVGQAGFDLSWRENHHYLMTNVEGVFSLRYTNETTNRPNFDAATELLSIDGGGMVVVPGSLRTAHLNVTRKGGVLALQSPAGEGGPVPTIHFRNPDTGRDWVLRHEEGSFHIQDEGGPGSEILTIRSLGGRVGVGTTDPQARLHVEGTTRTGTLEITGGGDIAEPFHVDHDGDIVPGMVVCIDARSPGGLRLSASAYDRTVAGVISGAGGVRPGLTLRQTGTAADGEHPVALSGRVWCKVDADTGGPIEPGDLLTTSATPGHAMRVADHARAQGAILGKAMTALSSGRGQVLILVTLQ